MSCCNEMRACVRLDACYISQPSALCRSYHLVVPEAGRGLLRGADVSPLVGLISTRNGTIQETAASFSQRDVRVTFFAKKRETEPGVLIFLIVLRSGSQAKP